MLHVEPDPGTRTALDRSLQQTFDAVTTVAVEDPERAVAYVDAGEVGCVVSEYRSESFDGLELL